MKKIAIIGMALLLFCLCGVAPVSAQDEPSGVIMQGRGQLIAGDIVGNTVINVNTNTGMVRMHVTFPGGFLWPGGPGLPDEQWVTGIYSQGEIESWEVDGSTVTIFGEESQSFFLPSHDLLPESGAGQIIGTLTGPGNRGTIDLQDPDFNIFTGTIIIR